MSEQEGPGGSEGVLSRESIHDVLSDRRRRITVARLDEHGPLPLPDLADEVARREHGRPVSRIDEDEILHVYLSLWHTHVPKLADADVVIYDQDRDIVSLGEQADRVLDVLDSERGDEDGTG